MFIIMIGSIVELAQASRWCAELGRCSGEYGFAVAVGVISLIASLVYLILMQVSPDAGSLMGMPMAAFLTVMWFFGVGVVTFSAPFTMLCNGYVATWTCFIASWLSLYASMPRFAELVDRSFAAAQTQKLTSIILAASVVELISASFLCNRTPYQYCTGTFGWAVALGVISAVFTGVILLTSNMAAGSVERLMPFFAIFIGVWWSFGLIFTTMSLSAPFTTCANLNGFLAVWTAFVASWAFAYSSYGNRPFLPGSGTSPAAAPTYGASAYGGQPGYSAPPAVFGYNASAQAANAPAFGAYEPPVPPMASSSEYHPEKGDV